MIIKFSLSKPYIKKSLKNFINIFLFNINQPLGFTTITKTHLIASLKNGPTTQIKLANVKNNLILPIVNSQTKNYQSTKIELNRKFIEV